MSQPFPEQVAPGGILVFPQIQSPDYVAGVSGWAVFRDGSVEFNDGTFRGQIIDSGMFVYTGTPGPGNPPVAWMTSASADPYGNTVEPLTGVRDPSTGQGVFLRSDQIVMLNSHTYPEAGASDAYFFAIPATSAPDQSQLYMMSPTDNQEQAMLQVLGQSEDLSQSPVTNFLIYNNVTEEVVAGHNVNVGVISAFQPGTTTPETWHTITLDSGWTAASGFDAPRYRLLPDGNLQLSGAASRAAFTANTNLNNSNPLPSAYRPVNTHHYRGVDNLSVGTVRAGVQISSGGVIEALTAGTSCTFIEIDAVIPLN